MKSMWFALAGWIMFGGAGPAWSNDLQLFTVGTTDSGSAWVFGNDLPTRHTIQIAFQTQGRDTVWQNDIRISGYRTSMPFRQSRSPRKVTLEEWTRAADMVSAQRSTYQLAIQAARQSLNGRPASDDALTDAVVTQLRSQPNVEWVEKTSPVQIRVKFVGQAPRRYTRDTTPESPPEDSSQFFVKALTWLDALRQGCGLVISQSGTTISFPHEAGVYRTEVEAIRHDQPAARITIPSMIEEFRQPPYQLSELR